MNEQQRRPRVIRLFVAMMVLSMLAFVPAIALRSLPLMLVALALQALAGIGLFSVVLGGRRSGPSRS